MKMVTPDESTHSYVAARADEADRQASPKANRTAERHLCSIRDLPWPTPVLFKLVSSMHGRRGAPRLGLHHDRGRKETNCSKLYKNKTAADAATSPANPRSRARTTMDEDLHRQAWSRDHDGQLCTREDTLSPQLPTAPNLPGEEKQNAGLPGWPWDRQLPTGGSRCECRPSQGC